MEKDHKPKDFNVYCVMWYNGGYRISHNGIGYLNLEDAKKACETTNKNLNFIHKLLGCKWDIGIITVKN